MELEIILIDINDHKAKRVINNELENRDCDWTESVRNSYHLIHFFTVFTCRAVKQILSSCVYTNSSFILSSRYEETS